MAMAVYCGAIRKDVLAHWSSKEQDNPYGILDNEIILNYSCDSYSLFRYARQYLHDEIDVDWGSNAYKGGIDQINSFFQIIGCSGADGLMIESDKEYGIVIMELICNSY